MKTIVNDASGCHNPSFEGTDRRKGGLDRVRRPQVPPVFGRT